MLRSGAAGCGRLVCFAFLGLADGRGVTAGPGRDSVRAETLASTLPGLVNAFARAEHDRLQRTVGQMDRHPCLFAQPLIEAAPPAGAPSPRCPPPSPHLPSL